MRGQPPAPGRTGLLLLAYILAMHLTCVLAKEYGGAEMASPSGDSREPSCEELRAMWRFSKRQSRATEITNEIPTYRDPFAYNVWIPYATSRSVGGMRRKTHVYGRPVFEVPRSREMARLFGAAMPQGAPLPAVPRKMHTAFRLGGGGALSQMTPQSGSFQHLQKLIRAERARELQEQRVAEEAAAARHAALKESQPRSHQQHQQQTPTYFGRMVQDQAGKGSRAPGLVGFPDLLAPPLRYAHPEEYMHLGAAQAQDRHRSLTEPLSRTGHLERGFFHH